MQYFVACVQRVFGWKRVWTAAFVSSLILGAAPAKAQSPGDPDGTPCPCYSGFTKSGNYCVGLPPPTQRPLCSGGGSSSSSKNRNTFGPVALGVIVGDSHAINTLAATIAQLSSSDDDPFATYTRIRQNDVPVSSGTLGGFSVSGRTNVASVGTDAFYNASKTFQLAGNQRLVVGGFFRYDSFNSSATSGNLIPNVTNLASAKTDLYNLGGSVSYFRDSAYVSGGLSGNWGRSDFTINDSGGSGSAPSKGWVAAGAAGNVFTLYDTRVTYPVGAITKVPPRPIGGYALQLDVKGYGGWVKQTTSGFADSTGFLLGENSVSFWNLGAAARLFATIPNGRLNWVPSVTLSVDQQINYSHTLAIPPQTGVAADAIRYGGDQTFLGVRAGVTAVDVSGLMVGVYGFYKQSSQYDIAGVHGYVRYRFGD